MLCRTIDGVAPFEKDACDLPRKSDTKFSRNGDQCRLSLGRSYFRASCAIGVRCRGAKTKMAHRPVVCTARERVTRRGTATIQIHDKE